MLRRSTTLVAKTTLCSVLAAAFAVAFLAPSARAQTIDAQTLGAAAVVPWMTGNGMDGHGDKVTVVTVTNGLNNDAISLHLVVFDDQWNALDVLCPLTPLETTYLVFERDSLTGTTKFTYECSDIGVTGVNPGRTNNIIVSQPQNPTAYQGIVFMNIECQANGDIACPGGAQGLRTRGDNALLVSATVIDFSQGYAFSVDGIHIQDLGANDGDRLYEFDGVEYMSFPSALATNYIAPDDHITADLILFTPDGRANDVREINAGVSGIAFDDDENQFSGTQTFDCFFAGSLEDIFGSNIARPNGGNIVGHVELFPIGLSADDSNENDPITGNSNGFRRRPVHGWIVQTIAGQALTETLCTQDAECLVGLGEVCIGGDPGSGTECVEDSACDVDETCLNGSISTEACISDLDCRVGEGETCFGANGSGDICTVASVGCTVPGEVCSGTTVRSCALNSECRVGEQCENQAASGTVCVNDATCAPLGFVCGDAGVCVEPGSGFCTVACSRNADCGVTDTCEGEQPTAVPPVACASDADCSPPEQVCGDDLFCVTADSGRCEPNGTCGSAGQCATVGTCGVQGACGTLGGALGGAPAPAGPFPTSGTTMYAPGAWGRTLVQGPNPLMPDPGDVPALHNGPPPL